MYIYTSCTNDMQIMKGEKILVLWSQSFKIVGCNNNCLRVEHLSSHFDNMILWSLWATLANYYCQ